MGYRRMREGCMYSDKEAQQHWNTIENSRARTREREREREREKTRRPARHQKGARETHNKIKRDRTREKERRGEECICMGKPV